MVANDRDGMDGRLVDKRINGVGERREMENRGLKGTDVRESC